MAKVNIKGVIISSEDQWIYDWFGIEATSPKSVEREIVAANGTDLEVIINSGGGDVFAGSEIYTVLKEYPGNVTGKIVGLAGSIASVIPMGCKKLLMSPTGQMMMHNSSSRTQGDYRAMEHTAGILRNVNQTIANAYMLKSGMDQETLLAMMDEETWLTPEQALEHKLIDEIMFSDEIKLVASIGDQQMLPQAVINKVRAMKDVFVPKSSGNKKTNTLNQMGVFNEKIKKGVKAMAKKCQCADCAQTEEDCKCSDCGKCPECCDNPSCCGCNCENGEKCSDTTVSNCKNQTKNKTGGNILIKNVNDLRQQYPELVSQIENAAIDGERLRLQSIDEISNTISDELVNKAKYEEPMTAQDLAFEALKTDGKRGQDYKNTRGEELKNSGGQNVGGGNSSTSENDQENAAVDKIVNAANQNRKGDKN